MNNDVRVWKVFQVFNFITCRTFNGEGKLNPNITVLGHNTNVSKGTLVLNSIILPYKDIDHSHKNVILL